MIRSSGVHERDGFIQDSGLVLWLLLHLLFWTGHGNLLRAKAAMQARFIPVCIVESEMLNYAGAALIALAALAAPEARAATLERNDPVGRLYLSRCRNGLSGSD